jgi:hypothetical protein
MTCARCDQPFGPDEKRVPVDHHSPSAAGTTVYVHAFLCKRAPRQTYPTRRRSRRGI